MKPATVIGAVLFSLQLASGQSTPQPSAASAATEPAEEEETVVLSPFEVTSETDTGYVATDTLAGSRIRTELRDVGGAVSVVTKEFLSDIGATDNSTLLQYTPNAEVGGTRGTYSGVSASDGTSVDEGGSLRAPAGAQRVRGLAAADNTRDFFVTDIPTDFYIVDRVDIQRGPNSILFGLGSPAGIVNAQTRNAGFRTGGSVVGRIGSYGSWRGSLDYNHVLVDDVLSVRVAGLWDREKFRQHPAFENDDRRYVALRFDPQLFRNRGWRTSIKAKYESGEIDANRPRNTPPYDQITAWFRPEAQLVPVPGSTTGAMMRQYTTETGMGKMPINNPYDAARTDNVIVAGTETGLRGSASSGTLNFQPWRSTRGGQQQPLWLLDGTTGQQIRVLGGYVNPGALLANGNPRGIADGILGKRYAEQFFGLGSYNQYANEANLPLFGSGQFRNASLQDDTVFDFYNTLIDGNTKSEFEDWDAYNIDVSQTAFDDRLGVNVVYDRQKYKRGGDALLGGQPHISMDILQNRQDFYLTAPNETFPGPYVDEVQRETVQASRPLRNTNGTTMITNPDFGRPFTTTSGGGRNGSNYESDREGYRVSLFGELRTADFAKNDFLVKLLGRQRLNAVYSRDEFFSEERAWNEVANSREWGGYWNANDGSSSAFTDRPPSAVVYLGSPINNRGSASGANIPGIAADVSIQSSNAYVFDSHWNNRIPTSQAGVAWNVPGNLQRVYGGVPVPGETTQLTEASNPANYIGWSQFPINLIRYQEGVDESLLTRRAKLLRKTDSYAVSWQAYLWNEAIIPTVGWRRDTVSDWDANARPDNRNRNILHVGSGDIPNPANPSAVLIPGYRFTDDPVREVEDDSTSHGAVVHLNRLFGERDPLPINVSFSYSKSSNFQVTTARRDVYGNLIPNPSGETQDYGVLLSTKDGKYSLRAIQYETNVTNGQSGVGNGIGGSIITGTRWRNVFLYKLSGYTWPEREAWGGRNTLATTVMPDGTTTVNGSYGTTITPAQGRFREDAMIRGWNEIQAFVTERGFFEAWSLTNIVPLANLTDRSTYEATLPRLPNGNIAPLAEPAAQYIPSPTSTVWNHTGSAPSGFTVTADLESKGYEFEFTANPLPNWRVSFNASKTTATRRNVGGAALSELVEFMDSMMFNEDPTADTDGDGRADGPISWTGLMPQFGGTGNSIYNTSYGPWRAEFVRLKLQEGTNVPEIRKWRFNATTNYTFREGFLKDVGLGASYRWQDKAAIGYRPIQEGSNFSFDLENPFFGPAEDGLDLWINYQRKISEKINWRIQLNGRNMFYNKGRIPISVQPDGSWATVRIKPTQEWFLTNTFSF